LRIRIALLSLLAGVLIVAGDLPAQTAGKRRALLIGINDYSASHLPPAPTAPAPGRQWPSLSGAVNDVAAMKELLVLLYGFERGDILTLTDQGATRAAILETLEQQLVAPAAKGDVILFYYAGHGSQVRNSLSDEPDRLDESIVPADSRRGAPDIRDKELRPLFNRILDRGARLSVILDSCHSGSGARGLPTGEVVRGVRADLRDVADRGRFGPRPDDRGALVITAAEDFGDAHEIRELGQMHGAFSAAWMHALRDAAPDEMAVKTFLRAQARLRGGTPFQEPVLAGNAAARLAPFLGTRIDRRGEHTVVAVEKVRADGTLLLQGGWANGLSPGSELRLYGDTASPIRVTVTAILGLGRSEAAVTGSAATIAPGALLEVAGWAAAPAEPLRVWMPHGGVGLKRLGALARAFTAKAAQRHVRWLTDPLQTASKLLLRPAGAGWELLGPGGSRQPLSSDATALAAVEGIPARSSLFVQFPAPAELVEGIAIGPGTGRDGIMPVESAAEADYILVGRYSGGRIAYAWLRPAVTRDDRRKSGLPLRSAWQRPRAEIASELRRQIVSLRRIQGWNLLESPPEGRSPYRLGLRRQRDDDVLPKGTGGCTLLGGERYDLLLRGASLPLPVTVRKRYVYAFIIDSHGQSILIFPGNSGSVENRFPLSPSPSALVPDPPMEIPLPRSSFTVARPYGIDSYFLLTTDEALPNPWMLKGDAVRSPQTPLEQLLALTDSSTRGAARVITPLTWSIEKIVCESVPSKRKRGAARQ